VPRKGDGSCRSGSNSFYRSSLWRRSSPWRAKSASATARILRPP
jgi:hypothetical protein